MTTASGKWKLIVYLIGIFAAGAVSGWVVSAKTTKQQMFTPPKWREVSKPLQETCYARLQLTPEQKEQFDAIIEDHTKLMESMGKDHMRQIRAAISNRSARVMAILTPEQQRQFEAIERERRESRHKGPGFDKGAKTSRPSGSQPQGSGPRSCVQKSQRSS
jgi:Spy/CpxP family protein refolding chaperone